MTNHQFTPAQGVLVAIDVAKARNEVLIEGPSQRRRRLTVLNTRVEHGRLIALLFGLGQPVTCAFEATGNYHRLIAWRLLKAGFDARLVSSLALARTREALHNSWDKNDPKRRTGHPAHAQDRSHAALPRPSCAANCWSRSYASRLPRPIWTSAVEPLRGIEGEP